MTTYPLLEIRAWEFEYHDDAQNAHRTYRIYLVLGGSANGTGDYWLTQHGRVGIRIGGGSWKSHPDGGYSMYNASDAALRRRNKGYNTVRQGSFTTDITARHHLDAMLHTLPLRYNMEPIAAAQTLTYKMRDKKLKESLLALVKADTS